MRRTEQLLHVDVVTLNTARLLRGWTWNDLARQCGFSAPTRAKLAQGRPVTIRTARRVCATLRIPLRRALILPASSPAADGAGQPTVAQA